MIPRYLAALPGVFGLSFGVVVACLGTKPRPLDRAVTLARIQDAGPQWAAAEAQYPELSVMLFGWYAGDPAFETMLRRWGHNTTFPVIGRCFPDARRADPTPAERACGRSMIATINASGYDYLRQFAVDTNGVAHRLILPTATAAVERFLAGGLETVERKRASGEPVALRDWGEAGLDVAQVPLLVAAGAESLAARGVTAEGRAVVSAERSGASEAIARAATSRWVWKTGGVLAVGYVAIRHPAIITALGGYAARLIGLPAWAGQAFVWAIGAVVLAMVVQPVLVVVMLAGRGGRVGYRMVRAGAGGG